MKFNKIIFTFLIGTMVLIGETTAQQQAMYTQYMFNTLAINPAYAGSHEALSLTALYRNQWVGLDGAPETITFSAHSPLKNERAALGLQLINDKIGVTNQYGVYGSYAYRIPMANGAKLSFGLQAGFNSYNEALSETTVQNGAGNPLSGRGDIRETKPNFGAGVYYYSDKFYLGFSSPQILKHDFTGDVQGSDSKLVPHYFGKFGLVFGDRVKFQPNMLVKMVSNAPVEFDLNANFLFNDLVLVGLNWRSLDSIDGILRFQLNPQLQLGYSYDFHTTELQSVQSGSHELMLNYRFSFSKDKIITPRYF